MIARRDAARAFLASAGLTPFLLNRDAPPPNNWQVPGYGGGFLDQHLIGLAEKLGWEGAHG